MLINSLLLFQKISHFCTDNLHFYQSKHGYIGIYLKTCSSYQEPKKETFSFCDQITHLHFQSFNYSKRTSHLVQQFEIMCNVFMQEVLAQLSMRSKLNEVENLSKIQSINFLRHFKTDISDAKIITKDQQLSLSHTLNTIEFSDV